MKTNTTLLKSLFFLSVLTGFLSCSDHRIPIVTPGSGRMRVKSITQDLPDNKTVISAFSYDGQGRLSTILAYQTPDSSVAPGERNVFSYDSQGRLTQVVRYDKRFQIDLYSFTYRADGQIDRIDYRGSDNLGGLWSASPRYNTANQLIGYGRSYNSTLLQTSELIDFTNNGNNITGITTTSTRRGVDITDPLRQRFITITYPAVPVTYAFDTNINPFYGLPLIPAPGRVPGAPLDRFVDSFTYYGGIANSFNVSKNNVLSAVPTSGQPTIYSYTYNAANLPTKRVTATGNSVTETLRFEYEVY